MDIHTENKTRAEREARQIALAHSIPLRFTAVPGGRHCPSGGGFLPWIASMLNWLDAGDLIIACDRRFFPILDAVGNLEEIEVSLEDRGEGADVDYVRGAPIISLPHFAKIYRNV